MFDKETYLLAKITSSEKNFAIKSSIFPTKFMSMKRIAYYFSENKVFRK